MIIDISDIRTKKLNQIYRQYLTDYRRYQIFKGSAGAGKSIYTVQKILFNIIKNDKIPYNTLCIRKVSATNHSTTFSEIEKAIIDWKLLPLFNINRSSSKEEITFLPNGAKILFRGLDDVEKLKSITFPTGDLICVWVEEASEISEDDFNQLDLRLRGKTKIPKHIILTFNPIDIDHWIKKRFFDNRVSEQDGFICETTYKDNRFIDDEYKKRLESYKDIDYYYYQVYALNEWGKRTGCSVFQNLEIGDYEYSENDFKHIYYGMDFGFNHANCLIGCGFLREELFIFKEYYYKQINNQDFIQRIKESGFEKDYSITADSEDPSRISEWNNSGFKVVGAKKGQGSLKQGINYLKQIKKIHIHKTNCPNTARSFLNFKYKQIKDGTILDDYVEIDDDPVACGRYALEDRNNEEFDFKIKTNVFV